MEDEEGRSHDDVFFVFFGLVDDRFVGFAFDSRSLSVAAGVRTLEADDFGGDSALTGLGNSGAGFKAAGFEVEVGAVPLG